MTSDNLKNFYSGKNIFITGTTGFLGVCLLEKILRKIPNHGDIYLLLRPKKGKEINERLEDIKKNSVFEELLKEKSIEEVFKNVKAIAGDVGVENLGLSVEDRVLLTQKVNVMFHSAATLDFAESLKDTVDINLLGTRRITDLAKECRYLEAFVHVSSAYVNSFKLEAEEVLYPLTKNPEELIDAVKKLSIEELAEQTPELLGDHPNTYTITKHMAEHEIAKIQNEVPCAIVRPSMIIGAFKEPVPGWTISKNGPSGFIMGSAKGVIRRLPMRKELVYDYIPVDVVVNNLLVAGFHSGITKNKTVEIYHCTSSTRNPFCWAMVEDEISDFIHKYPLMNAVWYPAIIFIPYLWLFKISAFFFHMIPAIFLDQLLKFSGKKPILVKLHRNVNSSLDLLQKFIFTEWKFHANKTDELNEWLTKSDQEEFGISINDIVWSQVFESMVVGIRVYLCNEPLKNLEAARRKHRVLKVLHYGLQVMSYTLLWLGISSVFNVPLIPAAWSIPIAYIAQSYI